LLISARIRRGIMVLMQKVASTAADAAYPNTSTNDMAIPQKMQIPADVNRTRAIKKSPSALWTALLA